MTTALITGGAGFFGEVLTPRLLDAGMDCETIDLEPAILGDHLLRSVQSDLRDDLLGGLFREHRFDVVYHCAAIVADAVKDKRFLWECNRGGDDNAWLGFVSGQPVLPDKPSRRRRSSREPRVPLMGILMPLAPSE